MPNNYFQFKQFKVEQQKCSMKVCTDACIFGSIISSYSNGEINHVLDIGTGTGLLALMYVQKNLNAIIDAIEIEENAFTQAKENFNCSLWKDRLNAIHADVRDFVSLKKYDFIICNPPFFQNDLKSDKKNINLARHDEGLNLKELISLIPAHLNEKGVFGILLPYHRIEYFETLAEEQGLFVQQKILIRQTPFHNFFRGILILSFTKKSTGIRELTIKDSQGNYTKEFVELMKDYYLNL